jgi:hypothetical protein
LFATGIYAIVKSIATLLSLMFFIDRTGRRKLLFIGAGGASLSMWYIGAYIIAAKVDPDHPQNRNAAAWIGIVMVYIYAVSTEIEMIISRMIINVFGALDVFLHCVERNSLDL